MLRHINSFDGTRISYDIKRLSGQFLILLHGLGGDYGAWKTERKFFHKNNISTIAIDLRGHGLSGRPARRKDYKLENFAKDVLGIIKKEKVKNFTLVGHCFGGIVAILFHKITKIAKSYVLVNTTYKAPQLPKFASIKMIKYFNRLLEYTAAGGHKAHVDFSRFIGTKDFDIGRICSDISHTSLKSWLFSFEKTLKFSGSQILKEIKKPVLVIGGEKDRIFNTDIAKKINQLVEKSRLRIIPRANHITVINNPDFLGKEILEFIA